MSLRDGDGPGLLSSTSGQRACAQPPPCPSSLRVAGWAHASPHWRSLSQEPRQPREPGLCCGAARTTHRRHQQCQIGKWRVLGLTTAHVLCRPQARGCVPSSLWGTRGPLRLCWWSREERGWSCGAPNTCPSPTDTCTIAGFAHCPGLSSHGNRAVEPRALRCSLGPSALNHKFGT